MSDFLGAAISATASHINTGFNWLAKQHDSAREFERQKEFAQNGIRWRVEDAKAAGIHPIYAIGANVPTYSPQAAHGIDNGIAQAGQDIGRAIEAAQTRKERAQAADLQKAYYDAQIENIHAQTEQHKAQAEAIRQGIINDALYNNGDFISQSAAASQTAIRTQQLGPSFPTTNNTNPNADDYKEGNIIRMIGLLEDPKGRLVSLTNTQNYHDNNEDVPIVEALPFLEGLTWDARAKITREPIKVGNKWYAYNGSEYKQIDVKTYKPYWKKWFINERVPEVKNRQRSQFSGGIRAFYGG